MKSAAGSSRDGLWATLLDQAAVAVSVRAPDGRYLACNAEFARSFDVLAERIGGCSDDNIFPPDIAAELGAAVADVAATGATRQCRFAQATADGSRRLQVVAFPLRHPGGELFAVASVFTDLGVVGPALDVTAADLLAAERRNEKLREALAEMELLATTDRLTGAWNRRRFEDTAVVEMARCERYGNQVSLLMLDLDHFKQVNDQHGHGVGDQVLSAFVGAISSGIRMSDSIARWGGEEFIVLARNTRLPEARRLAEKLRVRIDGGVFPGVERLTTSIGVAEYQRGEGLEGWLLRADRALYAAKSQGRNQVVVDTTSAFTDASPAAAESLMQLVWRDSYRTGHPLIDAQHERLFALANRLLDDIASGALRDDIVETIALLIEETVAHFADEEAIHRDAGFAEARSHAMEHERLLAKATRLSHQVGKGLLSAYDMFEFLAYEVVAQHMLGSDRRFFAHLQQARS